MRAASEGASNFSWRPWACVHGYGHTSFLVIREQVGRLVVECLDIAPVVAVVTLGGEESRPGVGVL